MSDHWESFPCQMGEDQAFILCDIGIRDEIESLPQHLLRLRIPFQHPTENGMYEEHEYDALSQFEDQMLEWLKSFDSHHIGRMTVAGHRHFFIATPEADQEEWMNRLDSLPNEADYGIAICTDADSVADAYWNQLYPGADDWQIIKDMRVIDALRNDGDDGSQPRNIDHWAQFPTQAAADAFSTWAKNEGYFVKETRLAEDGSYRVYLIHYGTLDLVDISNHTISLMRQAEECGGEYDGWGTAVHRN